LANTSDQGRTASARIAASRRFAGSRLISG
jgi:hypothetical protein